MYVLYVYVHCHPLAHTRDILENQNIHGGQKYIEVQEVHKRPRSQSGKIAGTPQVLATPTAPLTGP